MFDVLGYTDCRADQSLNGSTGFQFCAASPGAGDAEQKIVRPRVHHWARSLTRIPPEQHPETFRCWTQDGAHIILRGRSLTRRTASGRDGNSYSFAALTRDEWDILPARPAQLWSVPDWPSSEVQGRLAPWPTPLALDPDFEPEGLQTWVREQPWAVEHLAQLLTMVEMTSGPEARKLLIEHEDQGVVVRWISLAQLTMSDEEALNSSVHSFAEEPESAPATFVGAHPLFSDGVRPNAEGYRLFDPLHQRCTPVEPSGSARLHVQWFLTMDADEALAAISTSRAWARVLSSFDSDGAARIAGMVLLGVGEPRPGDVPVAAELLSGLCRQDPESVPEWGEELVGLLQACSPASADDVGAVGEIIWEPARIGETGLARRLASLCLSWGGRRPDLLKAWLARRAVGRPPLHWEEDEEDLLRTAADSATALAAALPADLLPELWTLLGDLGLLECLPGSRRSRLLAEAARGCLSSPTALERLIDSGRGEEVARLVARDLPGYWARSGEGIAALARGEWDALLTRPQALVGGPELDAFRWLRQDLSPLLERPEALENLCTLLPASAWPLAEAAANGDETLVEVWLRTHDRLSDSLEARLAELTSAEQPAHARIHWLMLAARTPAGGPRPVSGAALRGHVETFERLQDALRRCRPWEQEVNAGLRALHEDRRAHPFLVAYADTLAQAALRAADYRAADAVVSDLSERDQLAVARELDRIVREELGKTDVAVLESAVHLAADGGSPLAVAAGDAVAAFWRDVRMRGVRQRLEKELERRRRLDLLDQIQALEGHSTAERLGNSVQRGLRRLRRRGKI